MATRSLHSALVLMTLVLLLGTGGCESTMYEWGAYESSIERTFLDGSDEALQREVDRLEEDIARAERYERPLPPGVQAHVGYLYFLLDDHIMAEEYFTSEKETYPEAERFMNRLIEFVQ